MTNRKIHRWLSVIGIIFFLSVAATGIWLQIEAIFGEDEAAREAMATIVSPTALSSPLPSNAVSLDKARTALLARYGNRPVASVDWVIKAPVPAYVFHLDGAEPIKVTVNAATATIITSQSDGEDWVMRLHTGEIFGDGGKFLGLAWGLALIAMSITGIILYLKMLRARRTGSAGKVRGWRRYFW
jgi:uncharacterized iron-regulated membrane protein